GAPRDPEQVAEPGERDRARPVALLDEGRPRALVGVARDGEAVADADERPLLLEEDGETGVRHLRRLQAGCVEARGELVRLARPPAERPRSAGEVELRAAPLEPEERDDRGRPGLRRRREPGVERVRVPEPRSERRPEFVEPRLRERPP